MYRSILIFLFCLLPLLLQPVTAGDEDMLTPYAEFDPETGFFLPPGESPPVDSLQDSSSHVSENTNENNNLGNPVEDSQSNSTSMVAALLLISLLIVFGAGKIYKKLK